MKNKIASMNKDELITLFLWAILVFRDWRRRLCLDDLIIGLRIWCRL